MIAWLAVVLLGLADAEGAAVVIAFISLTLAWLAVLTAVSEPLAQSVFLPGGLLQFLGLAGGVPVVLASLAACSLAFSPGPRRGLAIVGWRRAGPEAPFCARAGSVAVAIQAAPERLICAWTTGSAAPLWGAVVRVSSGDI